MTAEEVQKAYDGLKEQGMGNEDIAVSLGLLYEKGEITKDQLGAFLEPLGLELKPEFAEMSDEEAKANLWENEPDEVKEGVTEGEARESEDLGEGEAPSDSEKPEPKEEEEEEESEEEESEEESEEGEDEDKEEEERKEAFRYMNLK